MRRSWILLLALGLAGAAQAEVTTANKLSPPRKSAAQADKARWDHQGGDTIETALPIPSLPFHDAGASCGAANNYDEVCPWTDSTAPDVVYSYLAEADQAIDIDLCPSGFDTKVILYAGSASNPIACNDDACGSLGLQSRLTGVALIAGTTYYIVVDGFGVECGSYDLTVRAHLPCSVTCPDGAGDEGEPTCGPDYIDTTNGGCNASPPALQTLAASDDECVTVCGTSGTYAAGSSTYRDTDWYEIGGTGQPVTVRCRAEFPLQLLLIYLLDCEQPQFTSILVDPCYPAELDRVLPEGTRAWIWVGPQSGVEAACGSHYVLEVCGLQGGAVPVARESWGRLKSRFR
jgi:hypothetical protein